MYVSYYDQPLTTMIDHASEGVGDMEKSYFESTGVKGYEVGVGYTVAKNVIAEVSYYDLESQRTSAWDNQMLWSRLTFSF